MAHFTEIRRFNGSEREPHDDGAMQRTDDICHRERAERGLDLAPADPALHLCRPVLT